MGAKQVTFSPEDVLQNVKNLAEVSPLPMVLPVYGDVPLFISADCIRSNACKDCPRGEKWLKLKRGGISYEALSRDCQIMLFDTRPLCFASEAKEIKAAAYRVDFCYRSYTAEKAAEIWAKVRKFEDIENCAKANINKPALL